MEYIIEPKLHACNRCNAENAVYNNSDLCLDCQTIVRGVQWNSTDFVAEKAIKTAAGFSKIGCESGSGGWRR